MKFRQEGKQVVTDNGVVRTKGSKSAARKTAVHLNKLDNAKQSGSYVAPKNSYRPTVWPGE